MYFFTFWYCVQKFLALQLSLCKLSCYFFYGFEIGINLCVFFIPILKIFGKFFSGHISTFSKRITQTGSKKLKTKKNFFLCFIEFKFAAIHGSVLLIFSKTIKTVVAHMVPTPIPIRVQ